MVHILDLYPLFSKVICQIFGHFLGQRRDQDALMPLDASVYLAQKVSHLPLYGAHRDERIQQTSGPDDLLGHLGAVLPLVLAGGGRDKYHLVELGFHFLELEGAVVKGRRQAETVLHQRLFAGVVATVHGPHLRQGDMALVYEEQEVVREIVKQSRGHTARRTARQNGRIVLDALADTHFRQHLNVVVRPLLDALGLDELAFRGELLHLRVALGADLFNGGSLFVGADDVVAGREDGNVLDHVLLCTREGVELGDAVDLVAEELHPDGQLAHISQIDVHDVAVDAELIADEINVIALILQRHQLFAQLVPLHLHPGPQADDHAAIVDGVAQRVDAGHRRDDDDVPPLRERRRGRVAQAVYLVVDSAVLFDIGIGAGDIGLRLVVVVVGDEIFHGVVREKRAELGAELGGQRLVVGQHQRWAVALGDDVRHREGLAAAGDAQQGLAAVAPLYPLYQLCDGLRLVARGGVGRHQMEFFLCHKKPSFPKLRLVVSLAAIIPQLFYNVNHSLPYGRNIAPVSKS